MEVHVYDSVSFPGHFFSLYSSGDPKCPIWDVRSKNPGLFHSLGPVDSLHGIVVPVGGGGGELEIPINQDALYGRETSYAYIRERGEEISVLGIVNGQQQAMGLYLFSCWRRKDTQLMIQQRAELLKWYSCSKISLSSWLI